MASVTQKMAMREKPDDGSVGVLTPHRSFRDNPTICAT
jgi:hypothetical protein